MVCCSGGEIEDFSSSEVFIWFETEFTCMVW